MNRYDEHKFSVARDQNFGHDIMLSKYFDVFLVVDLLNNCCHLVEKVLDTSDDLVEEWSDIDLVTAVCEAMKQTK